MSARQHIDDATVLDTERAAQLAAQDLNGAVDDGFAYVAVEATDGDLAIRLWYRHAGRSFTGSRLMYLTYGSSRGKIHNALRFHLKRLIAESKGEPSK